MMTHKNRDGTPISVELLNSVNSDRSRSRSANSANIVKDSSSKSNSSDDFSSHALHLARQTQSAGATTPSQNEPAGRRAPTNSLAAMMLLNPTPAALKEHCLSLTIQHSHDRNGGAIHHEGHPLKEQNSPTTELVLAQQQQLLLHQRTGSNRAQHTSTSSRASARRRGKPSYLFFVLVRL